MNEIERFIRDLEVYRLKTQDATWVMPILNWDDNGRWLGQIHSDDEVRTFWGQIETSSPTCELAEKVREAILRHLKETWPTGFSVISDDEVEIVRMCVFD